MASLADRYDLEEELGRGGMGVVYRARERASGREVALKLLLPGSHDPELLLRLRREAEALATLRHPGIVAVHAAGEDQGRPWLATELVRGARTLDRAWAGLDRAARVSLVRDVARALGHVHARGVVHRDVKAANVLVGDDGAARVVDFGVALLRGDDARLTRTGTILGTPYAMAPELVEAERGAVGPPTDVWALGVLLHEALTDRRPFEGRTTMELAVRILSGEPTAPRTHDPTVPPALEGVVLRALRRPPGERFADGSAFAAALDAASRAPAPARPGTARVAAAIGGALLVLLALLALRARPDRPPTEPTEPTAPTAPTAPVESRADLPREAGDPRREWEAVRDAREEEQGALARGWLARFPDHPQAARTRALALAHPARVIALERPAGPAERFPAAGQALFLDDASFVVLRDDPRTVGAPRDAWRVLIDLYRLDARDLVLGPRPLGEVPGHLVGRPTATPPAAGPAGRGVRRLALPVARATPRGERYEALVVDVAPGRDPPLALPEEQPPPLPWPAAALRVLRAGGLAALFSEEPRFEGWVVREPAETTWVPLVAVQRGSLVRDLVDAGGLLIVGHGDTQAVPADVVARRGEEVVWTARAPSQPDRLATSPDGAWLAIGTEDGHLTLVDLRDPRLVGQVPELDGHLSDGLRGRLGDPVAHAGRVVGLAFTPDSRRLVSVGGQVAASALPGDLRVWDVAARAPVGPPRSLLGPGTLAGTFDLSPDGRHALVGRRGGVEVWTIEGAE